jgi:hypothetical protein
MIGISDEGRKRFFFEDMSRRMQAIGVEILSSKMIE